ASLEFKDEKDPSRGTCHASAIAVRGGYVAYFPPREDSADATLMLERYGGSSPEVSGAIRFLAANPGALLPSSPRASDVVLLTNGRGGMARLCVDLGRVKSKYDCVLGANLNPTVPVDRHVFAKRIRV